MRVLFVLFPFFVGASLADNFLKNLMPVDFDNEDCIDGACFLRNQLISIDRSKTDPTTNLAYNEMSLAYVNTQNLLAACLPNVEKVSVAAFFKTCRGKNMAGGQKNMQGVCVFSNRGWLIKDSQNETVANLAFLQTAFSGLAGGDDAVNNCLEIKEQEEVLDDDYEYNYEYYDYDGYDDYDYLEEGEVMEVRSKREAGKNGKGGNKGKKGKGRNAKSTDDENKGKGKGKGKGKNNKSGKKGKGRNNKKTGGKGKKGTSGKSGKGTKKGKGRNGKKGKDRNKGKGKGKDTESGKKGDGKGKKGNGKKTGPKTEERKFVKKDDPSKKPSAENKKKTDKQLGKLGFSKMPKLSTLKGLQCIWDSLELLLVKCGEKIISESP